MDDSQRSHDRSTPQVSAKADAFVDGLLHADSSASWQTALQALASLSRDEALLAINQRASQLPSDQAEAIRRLGLVRKGLEEATAVAPVANLPPFDTYRSVAAGDLTPRQAGDLSLSAGRLYRE